MHSQHHQNRLSRLIELSQQQAYCFSAECQVPVQSALSDHDIQFSKPALLCVPLQCVMFDFQVPMLNYSGSIAALLTVACLCFRWQRQAIFRNRRWLYCEEQVPAQSASAAAVTGPAFIQHCQTRNNTNFRPMLIPHKYLCLFAEHICHVPQVAMASRSLETAGG